MARNSYNFTYLIYVLKIKPICIKKIKNKLKTCKLKPRTLLVGQDLFYICATLYPFIRSTYCNVVELTISKKALTTLILIQKVCISFRIWYVISFDERKQMFSEEKRVFITEGRKLTFTKSEDKNDAVSLNLNLYPEQTVSSHFSHIINLMTLNGLQMYI